MKNTLKVIGLVVLALVITGLINGAFWLLAGSSFSVSLMSILAVTLAVFVLLRNRANSKRIAALETKVAEQGDLKESFDALKAAVDAFNAAPAAAAPAPAPVAVPV